MQMVRHEHAEIRPGGAAARICGAGDQGDGVDVAVPGGEPCWRSAFAGRDLALWQPWRSRGGGVARRFPAQDQSVLQGAARVAALAAAGETSAPRGEAEI